MEKKESIRKPKPYRKPSGKNGDKIILRDVDVYDTFEKK
jgi:hypothetical protein